MTNYSVVALKNFFCVCQSRLALQKRQHFLHLKTIHLIRHSLVSITKQIQKRKWIINFLERTVRYVLCFWIDRICIQKTEQTRIFTIYFDNLLIGRRPGWTNNGRVMRAHSANKLEWMRQVLLQIQAPIKNRIFTRNNFHLFLNRIFSKTRFFDIHFSFLCERGNEG